MLSLTIVCLLAAPGAAHAWQVTVNVRGAGTIDEITDANLLNCTIPSNRSDTTVTACVGGSPSGGYGHGWIVELNASVPSAYFNRGWRFVKWVDGSGGGRVNCDPQDTVGDHFSANCRFQIFENLTVDAYFDDIHGPQDTSLAGGPVGPTNSTSASFSFNSGDPDAGYQCRLERPGQAAIDWYTCGTPSDKGESFSGLTANGQYTLRVRGRDPSGNVDETPPSWSWTVDTVPPTVSIGGGPAQGSTTNNTSASFTLNPSEAASFQCKLDRPGQPGTFAGCPANPSYSGLTTDGTYTFSARATDSAGNVGPTSARSWTVDTTPPETTIASGPSGATNSTTATFGFGSTGGGAGYECKLDGGAYEPCASGKSYAGLADGSHTFYVRAADAVGNTDPSPATRTWTVDTQAPDTTIASGPSGETSSSSATFGFSSDEAGSSFQCKLDSGPWETCTSGKTYTSLAAGAHTFSVRATDPAGNADASEATRSWTIVTTGDGGGGGATGGGTGDAGGTSGGGATGGGQTQPPPDTAAPLAAIAVSKGQRLRTALRKGLVGFGTSNEAGRLRLDVLLAGRIARKLRLARGSAAVVVATSSYRTLAAPGRVKLTAKFTRKAKRALRRARSVRLTLRLTAVDAAGNTSVEKRTIALKR